MLLASWNFDTVLKRFRSFNAKNLGSVGQRAAKLPAIKLWEWFYPARTKIRADWFECGRGCVADFFLRPPTLTASNFEALQSTDCTSTVLKDLNLLKKHTKNQMYLISIVLFTRGMTFIFGNCILLHIWRIIQTRPKEIIPWIQIGFFIL